MKCGIKVANRQCQHPITSGLTINMLDSVVFCCTQHYNKYKNTPYMDIPLYISTQKVIPTNNTPEEEIMNTTTDYSDADYDQEHSFENALAQLEGQLYTTYAMSIEGNYLIEICSHADCQADQFEMFNEIRGQMCCGESDCKHYTAILCLHHIPNNKEHTVESTTNAIIGNMIMHNMMLDPQIPRYTERAKGAVYCAKCSKEEGVSYWHPNTETLRACMGAAPAPARKHAGNVLTKEYTTPDGVIMIGEWYQNKHLANKRLVELKKGKVSQAHNENGHWVWYPKS